MRDFRKSWVSACKAARVRGRLFHDLRPSAVRDMIRAGVPQAVAREVSGHKSNAISEWYSNADRREALRRTQTHRETMETASKVAEISGEQGLNRDSPSAVDSGSRK